MAPGLKFLFGSLVQRNLYFLIEPQRSAAAHPVQAPDISGRHIEPFGKMTDGLLDFDTHNSHRASLVVKHTLDGKMLLPGLRTDNFNPGRMTVCLPISLYNAVRELRPSSQLRIR